MWIPNDIIVEVDKVATIYYVDQSYTQRWNQYRKPSELRLLTGWCWLSKNGKEYRYGFKSRTICYRDAWYALINDTRSPSLTIRQTK